MLALSAEGATVPFIARYRKERTGNLDEVAIRQVIDANEASQELLKRKIFVQSEIEKQGKLSEELKAKIASCFDASLIEDIYLPFKQKRKTKAQIAREHGLAPLAESILALGQKSGGIFDPDLLAKAFISEKLPDTATVMQGAQDIIIESLAENIELREFVRTKTFKDAGVISKKGPKAQSPSKYEKYFDYAEGLTSLLTKEASHRYLAMRRGWLRKSLFSVGGRPDNDGGDSGFEAQLLERFTQCSCPAKTSAANLLSQSGPTRAASICAALHSQRSAQNT